MKYYLFLHPQSRTRALAGTIFLLQTEQTWLFALHTSQITAMLIITSDVHFKHFFLQNTKANLLQPGHIILIFRHINRRL